MQLAVSDGADEFKRRKVFIIGYDPYTALDIAERLDTAGAEALPVFNFHHLSCALNTGCPDASIAELDGTKQWASTAVTLLHRLAVPQVLGATECQRLLLKPKLTNAVFMPAPLDPADALLSLNIILTSNWPRLMRHRQTAWRQEHHPSGVKQPLGLVWIAAPDAPAAPLSPVNRR